MGRPGSTQRSTPPSGRTRRRSSLWSWCPGRSETYTGPPVIGQSVDRGWDRRIGTGVLGQVCNCNLGLALPVSVRPGTLSTHSGSPLTARAVACSSAASCWLWNMSCDAVWRAAGLVSSAAVLQSRRRAPIKQQDLKQHSSTSPPAAKHTQTRTPPPSLHTQSAPAPTPHPHQQAHPVRHRQLAHEERVEGAGGDVGGPGGGVARVEVVGHADQVGVAEAVQVLCSRTAGAGP